MTDLSTALKPATLGDVLYAKAKPAVLEQDWAALVQSIAAGYQLALHTLYETAHRPVFTLIMRITSNRETAERADPRCLPRQGGAPRYTKPRMARCSGGS